MYVCRANTYLAFFLTHLSQRIHTANSHLDFNLVAAHSTQAQTSLQAEINLAQSMHHIQYIHLPVLRD